MEMTKQKAITILETLGYVIESPWHIFDVQNKYICDEATAREVIKTVLASDFIMEQINDQIDLCARQVEQLLPRDEEKLPTIELHFEIFGESPIFFAPAEEDYWEEIGPYAIHYDLDDNSVCIYDCDEVTGDIKTKTEDHAPVHMQIIRPELLKPKFMAKDLSGRGFVESDLSVGDLQANCNYCPLVLGWAIGEAEIGDEFHHPTEPIKYIRIL